MHCGDVTSRRGLDERLQEANPGLVRGSAPLKPDGDVDLESVGDFRVVDCQLCGGLLKPATISFGQPLRTTDLERAASAAASADLVLALGSTLSVHPAASIPLIAADRDVPYIIVNQGATDHDDHPSVTLRLEGDVTAIVPRAVDAALAQRT